MSAELYMTGWAEQMAQDCNDARQQIVISALSCLPPRTKTPGAWPRLWAAWEAAAARGVQVVLILPAPTGMHHATSQNRTTAERAIAAGMRCTLLPAPPLLHCKSIVIDEAVTWIGSGNFTSAAAHHNHEAYLRSYGFDVARQMLDRWEALKCL